MHYLPPPFLLKQWTKIDPIGAVSKKPYIIPGNKLDFPETDDDRQRKENAATEALKKVKAKFEKKHDTDDEEDDSSKDSGISDDSPYMQETGETGIRMGGYCPSDRYPHSFEEVERFLKALPDNHVFSFGYCPWQVTHFCHDVSF